MSNDFSNLLRNVEALESIDDFSDEDQPLENLELFLALISSGKTSWRIRRMKRRRKQKGKQGRRKGQRATYTRRWITHDCLAWNYIAPPTTPLDSPVRCAFIQLCIQPHPRLISSSSSPLSALIIIFPRVTSLRRRLFLRNPASTTTTKQGEPETRSSPPSPSPNLDWRVCFFEKFAWEGKRWPLFVLLVGGSHTLEWKAIGFFWWSRICIDSPIQQFTVFLVFDGRPFMASWTSRNSFEISNVWFYCEIVIFSSRLGIVKNITIHWKNNKEITIFVLLSLDSNRAG